MESWLSSRAPNVNESSERMPLVITFEEHTPESLWARQKLNSLSHVMNPTISQGRPSQSSLEGLL